MERPLIEPAPVVTEHAAVFRHLCANPCQCRHVQHDLTGLIVLPNTSLAHIARCTLESADNTHLSRFLSAAPWREHAVNRRRIHFRLHQTNPHRRDRRESLLAIDATRCEPVGRVFKDVDRHDNHRDGTSPLAPNPVTSCSVSGPGRCPVGLRRSRRDAALTPWEASVAKDVPDLQSPIGQQARHRLHTQVDPLRLQAPESRARQEPCQTTMALAIEVGEEAIRRKGPVGVVVFDAWSLAEDVVQVLARRRQDWISLLKTNRGLETARVRGRDAHGWVLKRPGPPIAVGDLVPRIPAQASRPVTVGDPPTGASRCGAASPPWARSGSWSVLSASR